MPPHTTMTIYSNQHTVSVEAKNTAASQTRPPILNRNPVRPVTKTRPKGSTRLSHNTINAGSGDSAAGELDGEVRSCNGRAAGRKKREGKASIATLGRGMGIK